METNAAAVVEAFLAAVAKAEPSPDAEVVTNAAALVEPEEAVYEGNQALAELEPEAKVETDTAAAAEPE